jgi:hypothetical protein
MKHFIKLVVIMFVFAGVVCASGFHIGMTSAVKSKVKELDEKVTAYKASHPSTSPLTLRGTFAAPSSTVRRAAGDAVNRVALVTPESFRVETIGSTGFSLEVGVEKGRPLGMVFINTAGEIAGCLTTVVTSTDTLSLLPLTKVREGTTAIDLQTIHFSTDTYGNIAVPTYDPVQSDREIPLSSSEKKTAAKMSKILAGILKNADVNGNGTVDFLEGKYFRLNIQYHLNAGKVPYGAADGAYNATVFTTSTLNGFYTRCVVYPDHDDRDNNFPLTFPAGYTWSHGTATGVSGYTQNTSGPVGGTAFPVDGTYTVDASSIGEGTLTFNVYGQEDAVENLVIPFPTYHVTNGKLTSVTWKWKLRNDITGPDIDPEAFISDLSIQVNANGVRMYNSYGGNDARYTWSGERLTGAEGMHTIGVNNLSWASDCGRIDFAYNDKFGNHVVVQFER